MVLEDSSAGCDWWLAFRESMLVSRAREKSFSVIDCPVEGALKWDADTLDFCERVTSAEGRGRSKPLEIELMEG